MLLTFCGRSTEKTEKVTYAPYFPAFTKCYEDAAVQVPPGAAVGCDDGKLYQLNAPDPARIYYYEISEVDPKAGTNHELTSFVGQTDPYWAAVHEGYYYFWCQGFPEEVLAQLTHQHNTNIIADAMEENAGEDLTLMLYRVALVDGARPELLWKTTDATSYPMLSVRQFCNHYLLMTVSYTNGKALTVYDLETNEMIIDASKEMRGAFMHSGKLYYVSPHQRAIEIYDLESQTTVGAISMEGRTINDMVLAGDADYLYVNERGVSVDTDQLYTNIHIYTYDGDYMNTIAAGEAVEYQNASYLFSTDTFIYIGSDYHYWPEPFDIYSISKNQLDQQTPEVTDVLSNCSDFGLIFGIK